MIDLEKTKELSPPTCHNRWMNEKYVPGLVSVIIPTYNRASMVTQAMESIWLQSYRPIEMLVIDDGSTDNTTEIIEQWEGQHDEDPEFDLRYFRQDNCGAPVARNLGLIESKGEFIQMLDSDDLLLPEKLSLSVNEFKQNPDTDLVFSPYIIEYTDGSIGVDSAISIKERNPEKTALLINAHLLSTPSTLHRRRTAAKGGPWNEKLLCGQEAEWQPRVVLHINKAIQLSQPQAVYRRHNEDSISGSRKFSPKHIRSRLESVKSRYKVLKSAGIESNDAYRSIAFNCISCTRAMIPAGAPHLVNDLFAETKDIWIPYYRYRLAFRFWRFVAILPAGVTVNLFRFISKLKHKVRFISLKLRRKRLAAK